MNDLETRPDSRRRLAPCPSTANCVSSQADRRDQRIEPFSYEGSGPQAMQRARKALESMPGCRIVEADDAYLRAEFTSRIFRFIDDLELLLDEPAGLLHVRSASRVGHWDLGTNRRRVEALRRRLKRSSKPTDTASVLW